ncbi:2,3-dihydroxybenzoate-AMP ligase [Stackebrandtia endophytica]|uniref:2,3-dihydroxybenzoate-AMP ligase n=1 Tax=Stackebrandtia endophytica TaxID=1496996 RepID=A0A543B332_9ACTN|nr:AMP-binding protein [Stackebrandtia endophytica]TQL79224.1 2,3-dihydroxybenzoate-AMP ligase [Stackebrandtia endophytica]
MPFTPWPDDIAERYRREGIWSGAGLADMLADHAKSRPEGIAVVDVTGRLSYAELADRVEAAAARLLTVGLEPGDIAVVQSHNGIDYLVVLFALLRLGVVPVCALPAHREAEIGYFCRHTDAAAYLHPGEPVHEGIAASVRGTVPVIMTIELAAAPGTSTVELPPRPVGGELALLQLSGGSTGVPKLIPRTHDDYLYSVRIAAEVCELDQSTVYLCALPVAHNFPLSSPGILGVLWAGGTVVMAADPSPDTCFRLIDDTGVTMTALVPALALVWLRAARQRDWKPQSLRVLQVGGARLDAAAAAEVFPVLGARVQQVFGMAEGLVCYTRYDDDDELNHTTQGRPASQWDEVRVVDDDDQPVAAGVPGHLLTRGPYTIRGYYRAPAHNEVAFTVDGFYRTGDLVRQGPSGHLTVTGRVKDQINRGGEKIAATEIEERLRRHPGIADAAVIAIPDPDLGERACAVCVADGGDVTAKQVRGFLRGQGIAAYKIPDLVRFVEQLPKTPVGKVDKQRLAAGFAR